MSCADANLTLLKTCRYAFKCNLALLINQQLLWVLEVLNKAGFCLFFATKTDMSFHIKAQQDGKDAFALALPWQGVPGAQQ